jgi:hypothetical protein
MGGRIMSLASNLRKAAELAAIVQPGRRSYCNVYAWGVSFTVEPLELVRIFNLLNVRKSSLKVSRTASHLHMRFTARGADFVALIENERESEFYASLGGTLQPKLAAAKQPRIGVRQRQPLLIPPTIGGAS